jgi:hypothetical protein
MPSPREIEGQLLDRCFDVALGKSSVANNEIEANVFHVAWQIISHRHPTETTNLLNSANAYFETWPDKKVSAVQAIRNGWISSLPRLADMLGDRFHRHAAQALLERLADKYSIATSGNIANWHDKVIAHAMESPAGEDLAILVSKIGYHALIRVAEQTSPKLLSEHSYEYWGKRLQLNQDGL